VFILWIFSEVGFFSVVKDAASGDLVVRSRIGGDLEALRSKFMPKLGPTLQLPGRDYPYRAFVDKDSFAEGMVRLVLALDYVNFKSHILKIAGLARELLYAQVWSVMNNAEERLKEESTAKSGRRRAP
jgi:hypothetical protein